MTNETNLSLQVFGSALANQIDESPLDLTPAQRVEALQTAEAAVRKTHFNEIQNLRKRGEGFFNAKRAAAGEFLNWQADMRELYAATNGERGFTYSEKTIENYTNLHKLFLLNDGTYERYRDMPAWIVYQVASYHLNGRDPESVPAIQALRNQTVAAIPESAGEGAVPGCGLPESYIALQEMCEQGDISQLAAMNIVDDSETSSDVVRSAVQLWGVRDLACVEVLRNIEESILRARVAKQPYNNLFAEAANTEGFITDERGDMIAMKDMSARELWNSHIKHRYQGVDGDDDPGNKGGAKSKKVMDTSIDRNEAIRIAQQLNNNDVAADLEADSASQRYDLKLVKPLA